MFCPELRLGDVPLVGSVNSNRRWLQEHLPPPAMPTPDPSATGSLEENAGWTDLFDAGEQAVQLDLKDGEKGTQ